MNDDLYLTARGRRIHGWTEIQVTLRADGFPNNFDIAMSSIDPATKGAVVAAAGDACTVHLGADQVISGYIDEDLGGGDARSRALSLTGRGKCADLADCAAEWETGQLVGGDALTIAQKLASFYGIEVVLANGAAAGPTVPSWALRRSTAFGGEPDRVSGHLLRWLETRLLHLCRTVNLASEQGEACGRSA